MTRLARITTGAGPAHAVAWLLLAISFAACSPGNQAALITVEGDPALVVRRISFDLSAGAHQSSIMVSNPDGSPLDFPRTVSLTFPANVGDTLLIAASGYDGATQTAIGSATATIVTGKVAQATLHLALFVAPLDGGADSAGGVDLGGADFALMDLAPTDLAMADLVLPDLPSRDLRLGD